LKRRSPYLASLLLCALAGVGGAVPPPAQTPATAREKLVEQLRIDLQKESYESALTLIEALETSEPTNHLLHNLRGVVLEKMGRTAEATAAYLEALRLQPDSTTARLNLALNYLRLDRFADGTREFAALVAREEPGTASPPNPFQQAPVGPEVERYARTLRREEAQHFALARLFLRHRLPEAARMILAVGTQALPESSVLHYALGWSLQELGRFEEAQQSFRRALALRPDYLECCLRLGYSYLTLGNYAEARESYGRCVEMDPQNYPAHYFLGIVLMRGESPRLEEAIAHLERAVKLAPHSRDARLHLGRAYATMGRDAEALRELRIAVAQDRENEDAHYRLSLLLRKMGRPDEARKHLERFEALRNRELARMREQLLPGPLGMAQSSLDEIAGAVAAFYPRFRDAVARRSASEIWEMLTESSKALYHDDPERLSEALASLDPGLLDRFRRSAASGGKLVAGRIICEIEPVEGFAFPPLVLVQSEDRLLVDLGFDLSLAGLAHLGAPKAH
jgi:tetratricopeptide (TPR) repeat protein